MKYKMELGISRQEIEEMLEGETLQFIFCNNEDLPNISVQVKEVEEDSTLSEQMKLSVDKASSVV